MIWTTVIKNTKVYIIAKKINKSYIRLYKVMKGAVEMNIDKNLLTAVMLCSRLCKGDNLKYLSFSLWHGLIEKLNNCGIENPSALLGSSHQKLKAMGFSDEFSLRLVRLLDNEKQTADIITQLSDSGIALIGMDSKFYPDNIVKRLQKQAPPVLFCAGNTDLLNSDAVSAVGSRKPSAAGRTFANKLGEAVSKNGFTLVSGGADGCDCIAESSATGSGGSAVMYLAVPLIKRMKNERVAKLILQNRVCLAADHSPYDSFNAGYALTRNKYIYSAAKCAVVCESGAEKGGSYNGAMNCIKGGLGNVLAFDNKRCYGNQMLILNGAKPVANADEVIDYAAMN